MVSAILEDEWKPTSVLMVSQDAVEYGGKAVSSGKLSFVMEDGIYAASNAQLRQDMFYEYECAGKYKFSFNVIENVKTTALRRFKR